MTAIRRLPTLLISAVALLSLAGCSALGIGSSPTDLWSSESGSSTTTTPSITASGSCQEAVDTIDQVIADAQQSAPQLIEDLLAGNSVDPAALIDPVLTSLDAAGSGASDPAIAAAIEDARAEWGGLATDMQRLGTPDLSELDLGDLSSYGELGNLQRYGDELSAIMSTRMPALQETGAALQEACTTGQ